MTTEDDFHALLDANPDDANTRLVFADWLQDRGDPRAEGYRAMGEHRKRPHQISGLWWWARESEENAAHPHERLPTDWFRPLTWTSRDIYEGTFQYFDSRGEAASSAALAFAQLPAARRAELLATAPASAP